MATWASTNATTCASARGWRDRYLVLGESDKHGGWTVRIYDQPLVPLLWFGILIMAAGGFVSLSDRRLRIGAPQRRRQAALDPAAA